MRYSNQPLAPESFQEFMLGLTVGPAEPIPEGEGWADLIRRIHVAGRIHRVHEEIYWYFLEVLPPRWMNGRAFAFAEGQDPLQLFWSRGQGADLAHFTRRLTEEEIDRFCRATTALTERLRAAHKRFMLSPLPRRQGRACARSFLPHSATRES